MKIGFLLFPNVTQLDMTGPLQALSRLPGAETMIVAKTLDPVTTDTPLKLLPSHKFDQINQLDMLVVPGGFGITAALGDAETIDFIQSIGNEAAYLTSVCTGALLLGGAGLLRGRKATTHWAYTDLLEICGAEYAPGRVVRDGNLFTGGGVTAGLDFAFTLIQDIAGADTAAAIQLGIEYNPAPPIQAGHPDLAPSSVLKAMKQRYSEPVAASRAALEHALC